MENYLIIIILMKMNVGDKIKLELQFKLSYYPSVNIENHSSILEIKVLNKDYRFEADRNSFIEYITKSGIIIASDNRYYGVIRGCLTSDKISLPSINSEVRWLRYSFLYEKNRIEFLKKLYLGIKEWSDNWEGFFYDTKSEIIVEPDKWIVCTKFKYY